MKQYSLLLVMIFFILGGCAQEPPLMLRENQVRVEEGQTIYMIAKAHKTTPRQIMLLNGLSSTHLKPGWIILIPPQSSFLWKESERVIKEESNATAFNSTAFDASLERELKDEGDYESLPKLSDGRVSLESEKPMDPRPPLLEERNIEFLWPLKGPVLDAFGKASGARALGITVGGVGGADVRAAREGEVAYVGDDLKEYGLLILIRHPDQSVTVYGHLKEADVKKGTSVSQGQIIGKVGNSGIESLTPRLYFELRKPKNENDKKPKAVNPLPHLAN